MYRLTRIKISKDIDALLAIENAAFVGRAKTDRWSKAEFIDLFRPRSSFLKRMENEADKRYCLAVRLPDSSEIIAYVCTSKKIFSPPNAPKLNEKSYTLYIDSFAVHPKYQRRGVGRQLLKSLIKKVEKGGEYFSLALHVRESNDSAKRLYHDCGFVPHSMYDLKNCDEASLMMFRTTAHYQKKIQTGKTTLLSFYSEIFENAITEKIVSALSSPCEKIQEKSLRKLLSALQYRYTSYSKIDSANPVFKKIEFLQKNIKEILNKRKEWEKEWRSNNHQGMKKFKIKKLKKEFLMGQISEEYPSFSETLQLDERNILLNYYRYKAKNHFSGLTIPSESAKRAYLILARWRYIVNIYFRKTRDEEITVEDVMHHLPIKMSFIGLGSIIKFLILFQNFAHLSPRNFLRAINNYVIQFHAGSPEPYIDAINEIQLPNFCDVQDTVGWVEFILMYGKKSNSIACYAKEFEQDLIEQGENPHAPRTLNEANQFLLKEKYPKCTDVFVDYSKLCFQFAVTPRCFVDTQEYMREQWPRKKKDNLPFDKIVLDGNKVTINNESRTTASGYYLVKLLPHDPLHFILGYIVTCCQRYGGNGHEAVISSVTDENYGNYLLLKAKKTKHKKIDSSNIYTDKGMINDVDFEIVAFTLAWCGNTGLCLDSIEYKRSVPHEIIKSIFTHFANRVIKETKFKRVTLGLCGATPPIFGKSTLYPERTKSGLLGIDAKYQYLLAQHYDERVIKITENYSLTSEQRYNLQILILALKRPERIFKHFKKYHRKYGDSLYDSDVIGFAWFFLGAFSRVSVVRNHYTLFNEMSELKSLIRHNDTSHVYYQCQFDVRELFYWVKQYYDNSLIERSKVFFLWCLFAIPLTESLSDSIALFNVLSEEQVLSLWDNKNFFRKHNSTGSTFLLSLKEFNEIITIQEPKIVKCLLSQALLEACVYKKISFSIIKSSLIYAYGNLIDKEKTLCLYLDWFVVAYPEKIPVVDINNYFFESEVKKISLLIENENLFRDYPIINLKDFLQVKDIFLFKLVLKRWDDYETLMIQDEYSECEEMESECWITQIPFEKLFAMKDANFAAALLSDTAENIYKRFSFKRPNFEALITHYPNEISKLLISNRAWQAYSRNDLTYKILKNSLLRAHATQSELFNKGKTLQLFFEWVIETWKVLKKHRYIHLFEAEMAIPIFQKLSVEEILKVMPRDRKPTYFNTTFFALSSSASSESESESESEPGADLSSEDNYTLFSLSSSSSNVSYTYYSETEKGSACSTQSSARNDDNERSTIFTSSHENNSDTDELISCSCN